MQIAVSDLEPIRWIGRLGAPVLVAAGSKDQHTTLAESRELFAAAAQPKSLWVVVGAVHQDLLAYDPTAYEEHVVDFLRRHLAAEVASGPIERTSNMGIATAETSGSNRPTPTRAEPSIFYIADIGTIERSRAT